MWKNMPTSNTKIRSKGKSYKDYLTAEDHLQASVIKYITLQYPKAIYHHSPNEGKRSKFEQFKAKYIGLKSGFPDLFIICNGKMLFLELKIEKGKVSNNQKRWLASLGNSGINASVYIAFGFEEAKQIIDNTFKNG